MPHLVLYPYSSIGYDGYELGEGCPESEEDDEM
jgi:hypothetical protein